MEKEPSMKGMLRIAIGVACALGMSAVAAQSVQRGGAIVGSADKPAQASTAAPIRVAQASGSAGGAATGASAGGAAAGAGLGMTLVVVGAAVAAIAVASDSGSTGSGSTVTH
jgi:hypothetical protein